MGDTETTRRRWDRQAGRYDTTGRWLERIFVGDGRDWACRQATGRTLEVAVGTGRNLPRYGPDVTLTGIDLSPGMLAKARERAAAIGSGAQLREADAEALPLDDDSYDTVVCTLGLCAIPDREAAVAQMVRVLRPGGTLVLIDHFERRWRRAHPADLAERAGLETTHRSRSRLGFIERYTARKPQSRSG
jgi:ubiquinone/menaquinone biosynthesis C-methylase UbiE